jgi:hypothetical protein
MTVALSLEDIRDDVTAELIEQGYTRAQAERAVKTSQAPDFATMTREVLEFLRGAAPAAQSAPKPTATQEETAVQKRICSGYDRKCTTELGPRTTTGLCYKCAARKAYHDKQAKLGKKVRKHPGTESVPEKPANGSIVMLELNEEQLNHFLVRLPLEDKHILAQRWLLGEQL